MASSAPAVAASSSDSALSHPDTPSSVYAWWAALTILLSAFLLFQVQPIISKNILPWFGGSPAVWTTCVLFFQFLLLGGYAYAHVLTKYVPARWQGIIHAILLGMALLTLPITPGEGWKPQNGDLPALRILILLAAKVGAPYFLLSSTGPLVQAWFSRIYPGTSPYRLYALSNVGSLGALLSYPIWFEPTFRVSVQGAIWSLAFVVFAALAGSLGFVMWKLANHVAQQPHKKTLDDSSPATPLNFGACLAWVLLAALSSLTLLAITNHLCQDVAVVPFLWVAPLSIYLISFILCFDAPWWYSRWFYGVGGVIAIVALCLLDHHEQIDKRLEDAPSKLAQTFIPQGMRNRLPEIKVPKSHLILDKFVFNWFDRYEPKSAEAIARETEVAEKKAAEATAAGNPTTPVSVSPWKRIPRFHTEHFENNVVAQTIAFLTVLFFVCMLCHGELVRAKPAPTHLTAYFLLISLGGAIGALTVAVLSPLLSVMEFELPLGIGAGMLIAWIALANQVFSKAKANATAGRLVAITALAGIAAFVFSICYPAQQTNEIIRSRNFYGSIIVRDTFDNTPEENRIGRSLMHGRILHGYQYQQPDRIDEATTYYANESGPGLAVRQFPREDNRGIRVAVVGLGTGTMAAHAKGGDTYRFYDIDPKVVKLSEDPNKKIFTFVERARQRGATVDIVLGDARISMEREVKDRSQEYDVLALDAFSGDGIPAHLLTLEAFEVYEQQMHKGPDGRPDGIYAIHISNRYIDLNPVVNALADKFNYSQVRIYKNAESDAGSTSSEWILLTRNAEFLENWQVKASTEEDPPEEVIDPKTGAIKPPKRILWTDQYSNIWQLLKL